MSDLRSVSSGRGSIRGRMYAVRVDATVDGTVKTPRPKPTRFRRRRPPAPLPSLLVFIATCVMGAMVVTLSMQYARTFALAREAARLDRHRRDLILQNAGLRQEIHRLRTDDHYIEEIARRQLGLVRPGEIEFLIVPPPDASTPGSPSPDASGQTSAIPDQDQATWRDLVPRAASPHGAPGSGGARGVVSGLWAFLEHLAGRLRP
jgi:cell division protein FtsB